MSSHYRPGLYLDESERKIVSDRMRQVSNELERVENAAFMAALLNGECPSYEDSRARSKPARSLYSEACRFEDCGKFFFYWQCTHDQKYFRTVSRCRSRVCPECAKIYRHKVWTPIYDMLKKTHARKQPGFRLAMLTLTVTSNRFGGKLPDRNHIARFHKESALFFRRYFGRWRGKWGKNGKVHEDRKHWQGAGFIAVTEVGFHNNNLHLHAIVWSRYVDQAQLKAGWERITGDSFGVHISEIRTPKGATNYIGSYLQKVPDREAYTDLADLAVMLKGSRRLRTGGIFFGRFRMADLMLHELKCPICGRALRSVNRSRIDDWDQVPMLWHARDADKLAPDDPGADCNCDVVAVGHAVNLGPSMQSAACSVQIGS